MTSAPHHPASNGLAERVVGIVNEGVKMMEGFDLETMLGRFLFDYRITPHSTTGIAPSELLMHRHLKTRLQLIKPDIGGKVAAQQTRQKGMRDRHAKARLFASGGAAYALRYHGKKESCVHGSIVEETGPLPYIVQLEDGSVVRIHVDQLQRGITSPHVVPRRCRIVRRATLKSNQCVLGHASSGSAAQPFAYSCTSDRASTIVTFQEATGAPTVDCCKLSNR